jgi:hypothetical protein
VRLTRKIAALLPNHAEPDAPLGAAPDPLVDTASADVTPVGVTSMGVTSMGVPSGPVPAVPVALPPDGPGAAAADGEDPCGPARSAVDDACSLADRMAALALAGQERLREAHLAYNEHAGRRERAANAADPRAVRAAKDEAQAAFRRARLAAGARGDLEAAAREWLREIDRVNARTREAERIVAREDAAETRLLQVVERLGVEADGARIAAESAAEACRNARITLANCEERDRLGAVRSGSGGSLAPTSMVARATISPPRPEPGGGPAGAPPAAAGTDSGGGVETPTTGEAEAEPAIFPLLAGDRAVLRRLAAALGEGDGAAAAGWEIHLAALVDALKARAIDGAALVFPEDHAFWGPHTQAQCREIAAALAALGYRYDSVDGFADGRVPGQRELSLAIGYAGLDPMRIRIWPTEAELPHLMDEVRVDTGRFVAEAAGELTLGEMIDLLGRRAEELSPLWNAWGRVRPLLLAPA